MTEKSHGLERMLFFSDAVIAIMLTLLALELPLPDAHDPAHLGEALAAHGSQYLAFLVSFYVIATAWVAHHLFFTHVSRGDQALVTLNVLVLLGYVLIPWASKTLGEVPNGAGVVVYAAAMAFLGGAMALMARHVVRAGLLDPQAPPAVITGIRAWSTATMVMFALSIPGALVVGRWVMLGWPVGYLALRLVAEYRLRGHRADTAPAYESPM
ncbi:TMEM175 family protein [Nonomuraea roseoviolacea subsp. roseoviolacea]|uniref:TMEM175 family protein n=1 Tax=Nonomuraea roseoviolacea TaxID=103837 RepID=UPI0031E0EE93